MPSATPATSRFAWVDGLRALSALWVIAYDVWSFNRMPDLGLLTPFLQSGHLGVEVFMVLSGFCLFYPLTREPVVDGKTWQRFFVRRAKRILPPYYAALLYALLLPFVALAFFPTLGIRYALPPIHSPMDVGAHVLLIHNLIPDFRSSFNPSFWSLSLEAQFYLLFPLLALAILRLRWLGVLLVLGLCLLYRWAVVMAMPGQDPWMLSTFNAIPGRIFIFFCGMLAAWAIRREAVPRLPRVLEHAWGLAIPGLIAAGFYFYFHPIACWPLSDGLIGIAIASALIRFDNGAGLLSMALAWRPLVLLGEISYSFYLLNRPTCYHISYLVRSLVPGSDATLLWLSLVPGVAVSIALAAIFYRYVEKPFLVRPQQPPAPSPVPA